MEKPTILVAEDERIIGFDLCETVAEAGYEVDGPFEAVSSAMLAFQKNKPDLSELFATVNVDNKASFRFLLGRGFNYLGWGTDITRDTSAGDEFSYYMSRRL